MKKINLIVLLLFFGFISFSQKNLLPGYIITNEGIKIEGLIDFREWDRNTDIIKFKEHNKSEIKRFSPSDIREFYVGKEKYISANVERETSKRRLENLEFTPFFNIIKDTIFLQVLFEGEKSLYVFRDKFRNDNLYILRNHKFELLLYKKYKKLVQKGKNSPLYTEKTVAFENVKYKRQLATYFQNSQSVNEKIEKSKYTRKHIIDIFKQFYKQSKIAPAFVKEKDKIIYEYGIQGGLIHTSLSFKGPNYLQLQSDFTTDNTYTGAAYLNMVFPRNQRKYSLNNEINLNSYIVSNYYYKFQNDDYYTIYNNTIGLIYFNIKNFIQITLSKNNFHFFGKIGVSNGLILRELYNKSEIEKKFYTETYLDTVPAVPRRRTHEESFSLGAGLAYKRVSMEIRYETGNGMYKTHSMLTKTHRIYGSLGIRFSK